MRNFKLFAAWLLYKAEDTTFDLEETILI